MSKVEFNAEKLMNEITVRVKVVQTPRFKFRMWLGLRVIKLGVLITGANVELEE